MPNNNLLPQQFLTIIDEIENMTESHFIEIMAWEESSISNGVKVVTLNYDNEFNQKISNKGYMYNTSFKNNFENIYNFFRNTNIDKLVKIPQTPQQNHKSLDYIWMESNNVHTINNQCESYKRITNYDNRHILRSIKHFDKHLTLIKFEEFDDSGFLHKISFYQSNLISQELYYRNDGSLYLIKNTIKEPGVFLNEPEFCLYSKNEEVIQEFKGFLPFYHFFLDLLVNISSSFILTHQNKVYKFLENYSKNNAFKIHYMQSFTNNEKSFLNPALLDGIIFSTESEKNNMINTYGIRNNYFVIPPFHMNVNSLYENEKDKETTRFVIQISENDMILLEKVIRAFRIAVDKNTSAILSICGTDILHQTNVELIESLELSKYVKFHGSLEDTRELYKSASFSMFLNDTNNDELDILESLTFGCPVISHDSNNFANEIITNSVNGFIVDKDSVKDISEKLINILKYPGKIAAMKNEAVLTAKRYNKHLFLQNWSSTVASVLSNQPKRTILTDMHAYMDDGGWTTDKTFFVQSEISLEGMPNKRSEPSVYVVLKNRGRKYNLPFYGDIKQINELNFMLSVYIDFPVIDLGQDIWDVFVNIEWENSFFQKRLYIESNNKVKELENKLINNIVNNRVIKPYPTIKGSNLSFNIGRFIPEKEELERLHNKFS